MSEIQAWTDSDLAFRAVMLKALIDELTAQAKPLREFAGETWPNGKREPAQLKGETGSKVKLGAITKADASPVATVTDAAAFEDYLSVKYGDEVTTRVELGDLGEVCAALADGGHDDLFRVVEDFPAWVREQAVKDALIPGRTVPGVTVTTPEGTVSVRPSADARALAREALSRAAASIGGSVPLLAIEGGAA